MQTFLGWNYHIKLHGLNSVDQNLKKEQVYNRCSYITDWHLPHYISLIYKSITHSNDVQHFPRSTRIWSMGNPTKEIFYFDNLYNCASDQKQAINRSITNNDLCLISKIRSKTNVHIFFVRMSIIHSEDSKQTKITVDPLWKVNNNGLTCLRRLGGRHQRLKYYYSC